LARLDGQHGLMADLLYGAGLRLLECVRLRVKDVDFEMRQIKVRDTHVLNRGGHGVASPLDRI